MDESVKIKHILNMPDIREDWFRWYGITERRKESLLENSSHPNSFFNPNSESTLTLFMLGNLCRWDQRIPELGPPRNERSDWNRKFFERLTGDSKKDYISDRKDGRSKDQDIVEILGLDRRALEKHVLLFEVEMYNDAVHLGSEKSKHDISFLDIEGANGWVRYDAVMIFPENERFMFFESKLESDLSYSSKDHSYLDQMMRGLETAHLLTEKEDSPYTGWDFDYVLLCPELLDSYGLTRYNRKVDSIGRCLVEYNDLLNERPRDEINQNCYPDDFGSFVKRASERINRIYWKDLASAITNRKDDFFSDYFRRLEKVGIMDDDIKNIRRKFRLAGIRV